MSYKVETAVKKHTLIQLEVSKTCIKDIFKDPLDHTKGFKYQITLKKKKKNTSLREKSNLLQFISIRQQK